MAETIESCNLEWHHPSEVMKLHKLKKKKNALQARIKNDNCSAQNFSKFEKVFSAEKRKNPFLKNSESKRSKIEPSFVLEESEDQTLFKLLNHSTSTLDHPVTNFNNILNLNNEVSKPVELVKAQGEKWIPIDWSLKYRMRLLSLKPFPWNQKLKISEEASAITAFTRCLDNNTATTLDISPNAKFYQCCLYWQQPALPWLSLFPRTVNKSQISSTGFTSNSVMKESLQNAWSDSLRSLFQLIRTGQCPYFYACANNFTVLFRAAGICGFSDVHAVITPTTRGFRKLLKQEDIEFTMPLKNKRDSDLGYGTDSCLDENEQEDIMDDNWLRSFGVNDDDLKHINYTQDRIQHKVDSETDNSEYSTVLIEGVEVQALYNFLINCKSATSMTGPFADIPPTLLAPVSFHGSTVNSLKIRESKVHTDDDDYYSLELMGPILPTTIHNLFEVSPPEHNTTITFNTTKTTEAFSKLNTKERKSDLVNRGAVVFRKENLSDCGLLPKVLKHFCVPENDYVTNVECLKYISENGTYSWT